MSYQNNPGGYQQQPYQQGQAQRGARKEKINEWCGVGIVRPKSANENDVIKFYPYKDKDGGIVNFNLKITEFTGTSDEYGNPRQRQTSVPVSVRTNKNITSQQLQSVVSGMKVRIVGRLELQSYKSTKTGMDVTALVVVAHVFEILEMPMQAAQQYQRPAAPGYAQGGAPYQQPAPQGYQQGGYSPYPPQQGGYMQGQNPPYPPAMPAQQQGQMYQPQGQMPSQNPPYYQPPQGQQQQQGQAPVIADMPSDL